MKVKKFFGFAKDNEIVKYIVIFLFLISLCFFIVSFVSSFFNNESVDITVDNFAANSSDEDYVNQNKLHNAYEVADNSYICDYYGKGNKIVRFGVTLNYSNYKYEIFLIDFGEENK